MHHVLSYLFLFLYFKGDAVFEMSYLRLGFTGQIFQKETDPVRPMGRALLERSIWLIANFQFYRHWENCYGQTQKIFENNLAAAAQIVTDIEQKWEEILSIKCTKVIPILIPHLEIFLMISD